MFTYMAVVLICCEYCWGDKNLSSRPR